MYNIQTHYYQFGYSGYDSLLKQGSVYTQSELLANGVIREIVCDIDDKWMRVTEMDEGSKERHEIDLSVLKYGVTVDLSENGERWEGNFLNGYPYGYGCLYNSENQLIYSGFIYEGKWNKNMPLQISSLKIEDKLKEEDIHYGLEDIQLCNIHVPQTHRFVLKSFQYLQRLVIGNSSFKYTQNIILES